MKEEENENQEEEKENEEEKGRRSSSSRGARQSPFSRAEGAKDGWQRPSISARVETEIFSGRRGPRKTRSRGELHPTNI